jgi:hypothetical protein
MNDFPNSISLGAVKRIASRLSAVILADANGDPTGTVSNPLSIGPLPAGENHVGEVGGPVPRIISASFTRPNDVTAYTSGDIVANSATAGSVTPLSFDLPRAAGRGGMIRRARLRKSGTGVTSAVFRIHLYRASPITVANGDNGAFSTDQVANYVGKIDITVDQAFTDGASGNGVPAIGSEINFAADTYYALVEARGAYTPVAQEVFTLELEILPN